MRYQELTQTLSDLRETKVGYCDSMTAICEEAKRNGDPNLSRDQQRRFDLLDGKIKEADESIKRYETHIDRLRAGSQSQGRLVVEPDTVYTERAAEHPAVRADQTVAQFLRERGKLGGEDDYRGLSLGRYLRSMVVGPQTEIERRALSEGTDSQGGFTVPTVLGAGLLDRMREVNTVLQSGAQLVPIQSDSHSFAKVLTDPVPSWRAENTELTESEPTFGRVELVPKTVAIIAKASRELIEDSVNLETELPRIFAKALSNELDRVALVGSGSGSEPTGIANMASVTEVSMGVNGAAISDHSELLDLVRDLLAANAPAPTDLVMSPRTWRTIEGFADSTNQPLQRPPSLANVRFKPTAQVPNDQTQGTANDASSIYAGNFSELWIGFRPDVMRVEVLKERYAEFLQYAFLVWARWDVQAAHETALGRLVGIVP